MTLPDLEIRKATTEDLSTITAFNQSLFRHEVVFDPTLDVLFSTSPKGQAYFSEWINAADTICLIAFAENIPVGYLLGGLVPAESYRIVTLVGEIESMFITEIFRKQGVGAKLIQEFSKWCKSNDIVRIRATTYTDNSEAMKFYTANEFLPTSVVVERDI